MEGILEEVFEIMGVLEKRIKFDLHPKELVSMAIDIQRNMILAGLSGQLPEIISALNEISDGVGDK